MSNLLMKSFKEADIFYSYCVFMREKKKRFIISRVLYLDKTEIL